MQDEDAARLVERKVGLDIGGTLCKAVYVLHADKARHANVDDNLAMPVSFPHLGDNYVCMFRYFQTRDLNSLVDFLTANDLIPDDRRIHVTGGGSYKFEEILSERLGIEIIKKDEMQSVMTGVSFATSLEKPIYRWDLHHNKRVETNFLGYPFLVVNVGSGVSILKAIAKDKFLRVSGTCIGGGTALGLCKLCFGAESFDEVVKLSELGSDKLDLQVADILGDTAGSRILPEDALASSFGRLYTHRAAANTAVRKEDVARSCIRMISYNLGYLGILLAQLNDAQTIFFTGKYISNHDFTIRTITQAVVFYSLYNTVGTAEPFQSPSDKLSFDSLVADLQKKDRPLPSCDALFIKLDGYLGAIGAILSI